MEFYSNTCVELNEDTVVALSEASSIIRIQHRLQNWLGIHPKVKTYILSDNYKYNQRTPSHLGYILAHTLRAQLGLGSTIISSMKELIENELCVPVIQIKMSPSIHGVVVTTADEYNNEIRGIVINASYEIQEYIIAQKLAQVLYDSNSMIQTLQVGLYENNNEQDITTENINQRNNAFSLAFHNPTKSLAEINNDLDAIQSYTQPYPKNHCIDDFPISTTPIQRQGRFAGLVAASYEHGLISEHTAAQYLNCETTELKIFSNYLRNMFAV